MNFDEFYGGVCRRNKENPNAARNTTIEGYCRQAFQAGAASRDAYIEQLELALLQVRKAICGDIHNTDDLLDLIASRDSEIAELVAALETVIANAPEPYCAITRAVDAQCRAALAKTRKP